MISSGLCFFLGIFRFLFCFIILQETNIYFGSIFGEQSNLSHPTTYQYDDFDRIAQITYPDGTTEIYEYDRLDLHRHKNANGEWTNFRYNPNRQIMAITNTAGETSQFMWCKCGALSGFVDPMGRTTTYDRDIQGRITQMNYPLLPGQSTPASKSYTYDTVGRLKTFTDAKGQVTTYNYNNQNNSLAGLNYSNTAPGTHPIPNETFTYDWARGGRISDHNSTGNYTFYGYRNIVPSNSIYGDGKLTSFGNPTDTVAYQSFQYDQIGRISEVKVGCELSAISAKTNLVYDTLGRISSFQNQLDTFSMSYYPRSSRVHNLDSSNGPIESIFGYGKVEEMYNLRSILNRNKTNSSQFSRFFYNQDALGRITQWDWTGGAGSTTTTHSIKYDRASRLTEMLRLNLLGNIGTQWNFRYDKTGNRLNRQLETFNQAAPSNASTLEREEYTVNGYDQFTNSGPSNAIHFNAKAQRQLKASQTGKPIHYTEKPDSNNHIFLSMWTDNTLIDRAFVALETWYGHAIVNATIQLFSLTSTVPTRSFEYDANGNMTKVTTVAGSTTTVTNFEWDFKDRLVAVQTVGGNRTEFTYDHNDNRIRIHDKNSAGATVSDRHFIWSGLSLVAERDGPSSQNIIKRYTPQGEIHSGGVKYYYTFDHLGNMRGAVNESGTMVAGYSYDPFGLPNHSGSMKFDILFTGHFYHEATGLYLAKYRAYDPKLGRWLSREPLGLDGPNPYHYGFNNPMNLVDKSGLTADYPDWWNPSDWVKYGFVSPIVDGYFNPLDSLADHNNQVGGLLSNYQPVDANQVRSKVSDLLTDTAINAAGIVAGEVKMLGECPVKVNWGHQEKHFPGHNSYRKGRSILTANPEKLISKAGTGDIKNGLKLGQPGVKEVIDYGEIIGTYIPDGMINQAVQTTRGTLHYGKKGIHIVPASPK